MVIQRKILNRIKDHLEEKYRLDMNGGDIRLAFALYTAYQNDTIVVTELKKLVQDAFDVFGKEEPRNVGITAYQRSIYRALEVIDTTDTPRTKVFERLLNEVSE
jgi:meiotically up-regulated gene 157 (Mug157) protein